jgi:SEC-C motif-containing protein
MRSRYSGFVRDLRPHLLATWHPDHRPAAIEPPEPGLKWLGLTVQQAASHALAPGEPPPAWAQGLSGGPIEAWGEVAFVARYKLGGRAHRLAEHSVFVRQAGLWFYVAALPESG